MKYIFLSFLLSFSLLIAGASAVAGDQTIIVKNDEDQRNITSKVYTLENVSAADIRPFVEGAVLRSSPSSSVTAVQLNGKDSLVVTMPVYLVPSVDDMIKKLDSVKDSQVEGTGITDYVYKPKNVPASSLAPIAQMVAEEEGGRVYVNRKHNIIAFKGPASMQDVTVQLLTGADKTVRTARLIFKLTTVNESGMEAIKIANANKSASYFEISGDASFLKTVKDKSEQTFEVVVQAGTPSYKIGTLEISDFTADSSGNLSGKVKIVSGELALASSFRLTAGEERFIAAFKKTSGSSSALLPFESILSGKAREGIFLSVSCVQTDLTEKKQ